MEIGSFDKTSSRKLEKLNSRKTSLRAYYDQNQPGSPTSIAYCLSTSQAPPSNETCTSSFTSESGDDFSPNRYHSKSIKNDRIKRLYQKIVAHSQKNFAWIGWQNTYFAKCHTINAIPTLLLHAVRCRCRSKFITCSRPQ